ncbi:MAG: FAD-binding protein [Bacteroidales bacterium]|nr:FAD-binding protein [Bacteroidales bacterium]
MEILTDSLHRIAYATDASIYREMPLGVAYPKSEDDIIELISEARRRGTHLIPRAGGTSIAGQVVGNGIVVDISRHLNNILEFNQEERWVWVEPGVVRDELNKYLEPHGLFFSPETSTSNRCCIGGMVGNNSCGTHSLVYGSTRHHVIALKGILSDGSHFDTTIHDNGNILLYKILAQLHEWANDPHIGQIIADNFPDISLRRRSCGYAIDEAIQTIEQSSNQAICNLLCGSEGTLAFITAIKLSLDPLPPKEKMILCAHCHSLPDSYRANLIALKHNPVAIELMDGKILELCRNNHSQQSNQFFIKGEPEALLIAEFNGANIDQQADALEHDLLESGLSYHCSRVYNDDISRVWALRKAGLGVLTSVKGDRKPIGVIEDTAVAPERLPEYLEEFEQMMQRHGLSCVYYGHISTGELHLRPILDVKQPKDRHLFRQVAEETAMLVRKYRGSLSGEHGDGRLRGEFIPLVYGQEVYNLMREVKQCWDPDGVFNMHKIVDTPPMDESLRYDVNQQYACPDRDLMCSIEQCNGAGDCRKSNVIGGTMCPTFKLTHDELLSTRARANVLREILTHGLPNNADTTEEKALEEMLYSCLACKGCHGECPSNVDMTTIRARVLQMLYHKHGTPFRSWMVAHMADVERLGHIVWPIYNIFATWGLSSAIIKHIVSFTPQRSIPTLSPRTMRQLIKATKQRDNETTRLSKGKVYLFADEFTNFQEAQLGLTFAQLLTQLGYRVEIPRHVESGRAAISKGCLDTAARFAKRNVSMLKDKITEETPLVGIEPSCILSFRDEYPDLVPADMRADAERLGRNCLLYDEFIMREVAKGNITPDQFNNSTLEVWLHGHCHQKSLVGIDKTAAMLRLLPGCNLHVIPSSCCGMAGSFGYEKEHYQTSLAIGEMLLFPTIRKALTSVPHDIPAYIAAPGTSCRQQIYDGTGHHALHPIEIMYQYLKQ